MLYEANMTTIRLNDDLNSKLLALKNIEQVTKTEIIKRAIVEYYEHHVNEKTPYELGERNNFVQHTLYEVIRK